MIPSPGSRGLRRRFRRHRAGAPGSGPARPQPAAPPGGVVTVLGLTQASLAFATTGCPARYRGTAAPPAPSGPGSVAARPAAAASGAGRGALASAAERVPVRPSAAGVRELGRTAERGGGVYPPPGAAEGQGRFKQRGFTKPDWQPARRGYPRGGRFLPPRGQARAPSEEPVAREPGVVRVRVRTRCPRRRVRDRPALWAPAPGTRSDSGDGRGRGRAPGEGLCAQTPLSSTALPPVFPTAQDDLSPPGVDILPAEPSATLRSHFLYCTTF